MRDPIFLVEITDEDRTRAGRLACKRERTFAKAGVENEKIDANVTDDENHFKGLVAEIAVEKLTGVPLTNYDAPHGDGGGYDFILKGQKVQVKCTHHQKGHLAFPLKAGELSFKADYAVLATWDPFAREVWIVGQCSREKFLKEHVIKKWQTPTPALPQEALDYPELLVDPPEGKGRGLLAVREAE